MRSTIRPPPTAAAACAEGADLEGAETSFIRRASSSRQSGGLGARFRVEDAAHAPGPTRSGDTGFHLGFAGRNMDRQLVAAGDIGALDHDDMTGNDDLVSPGRIDGVVAAGALLRRDIEHVALGLDAICPSASRLAA